jgi:hypothetical protein
MNLHWTEEIVRRRASDQSYEKGRSYLQLLTVLCARRLIDWQSWADWSVKIEQKAYLSCCKCSANHILIMDWRVTPRRRASRSRAATIQAGKSTLMRFVSSPGRRA